MEYTLIDNKRGVSFSRIEMDEVKFYIEVNDPNIADQEYCLIDHQTNQSSAFYYDLNDNITQVKLNNLLRFKNKN